MYRTAAPRTSVEVRELSASSHLGPFRTLPFDRLKMGFFWLFVPSTFGRCGNPLPLMLLLLREWVTCVLVCWLACWALLAVWALDAGGLVASSAFV